MSIDQLITPMAAHVAWAAFLFVVLTIVRAPTVWKIGAQPDGTNPLAEFEPRVSANLKNQFEWPLVFYVACLIILLQQDAASELQVGLAWLF
ncbi:MAG: MAPEG family protein, partial [Planctomycetota bacterium]